MQAEEAQIQQKKVYDDVVNERDVLGTQLIRRNDELALLYEKIKIQQTTLNKGELQVMAQLNDYDAASAAAADEGVGFGCSRLDIDNCARVS
jgi:hypothetical protein